LRSRSKRKNVINKNTVKSLTLHLRFEKISTMNIKILTSNKQRNQALFAGIVACSMMITSCATIFCGSTQTVRVKSDPPGASVFINGQAMNRTTPCTVEVTRRTKKSEDNNARELVIDLKKEGYNDAQISDYSGINGLVVIDFFPYIFPGIIDIATGSNLRYKRKYNLSLTPATELSPVRPKKDSNPVASYLAMNEKSDVDIQIPENKEKDGYRFALIIGNEDYSSYQPGLNSEMNVIYAKNDAVIFKEYAFKTLGVPEDHIIFMSDATLAQMNRGLTKLNLLIKNSYGEADVFVYYAGHGLPDDKTKEAYLLPVDVSGTELSMAIPLKEVYQKLSEYPSKQVTCFLDCCFSGGARNNGLIAARGVKVKPREVALTGNLVVFTATSGEQSALAFDEKKHGIFTYYLLKKLKETQGKTTYGDLADYLKKEISLQSVLINNKEQEPQVNVGEKVSDSWKNIGF